MDQLLEMRVIGKARYLKMVTHQWVKEPDWQDKMPANKDSLAIKKQMMENEKTMILLL